MRRCQVILFDGTERPRDLGRGPTWLIIRDLVADTSYDSFWSNHLPLVMDSFRCGLHDVFFTDSLLIYSPKYIKTYWPKSLGGTYEGLHASETNQTG